MITKTTNSTTLTTPDIAIDVTRRADDHYTLTIMTSRMSTTATLTPTELNDLLDGVRTLANEQTPTTEVLDNDYVSYNNIQRLLEHTGAADMTLTRSEYTALDTMIPDSTKPVPWSIGYACLMMLVDGPLPNGAPRPTLAELSQAARHDRVADRVATFGTPGVIDATTLRAAITMSHDASTQFAPFVRAEIVGMLALMLTEHPQVESDEGGLDLTD